MALEEEVESTNDAETSRQQVADLKAGFRTRRCNTEGSNWRPKQNQIPGLSRLWISYGNTGHFHRNIGYDGKFLKEN